MLTPTIAYIGAILLNDRYGKQVNIIETVARGNPEVAVREIYRKWLDQDAYNSWATLLECFRHCKLNRLASDIEQHLGLPSSQQTLEGMIV